MKKFNEKEQIASIKNEVAGKVIIHPKTIARRKDGALCEMCSQHVAMITYRNWQLTTVVSEHPVCSMCMLYESPWGRRLATEIKELLKDMEQRDDTNFLRDSQGKLILASDADHVFASIAMASNLLFAMQDGTLHVEEMHSLLNMAENNITPEMLFKQQAAEGKLNPDPQAIHPPEEKN